jgi:DNA-directed RNA polymerase subunit RPC12/RpoP
VNVSESVKMERNVTSLKYGIESPVLSATHASSRCSACGEDFETPLLAMVFSDSLVEEYYACPKCLSKVGSVGRQKDFEVDEAEEEEKSLETEFEDTIEETVGCTHHLGYLKRRPKNTPIPEECLTCSKMIECMY